MRGYAPGWQIRCPVCGRTREAAAAGIVRVGAWSRGKRTLGWCRQCRRFRLLAVERAPAADPAAAGPGPH